MSNVASSNRLDRAIEPGYDHVLGPADAEISLVEYGSYACPHCRAANEEIAALRDRFGARMRYVFRHRPLTNNPLADSAAEIAECAEGPEQFWNTHVALMTRSAELTHDDVAAVAGSLGLTDAPAELADERRARARRRVEADRASAKASGVAVTPTFFINGRRYDGAWDQRSLSDAMLGSLGHRMQTAAVDFASWAPSVGVLLLLAVLLALALSNSPLGPSFLAFWEAPVALSIGEASFGMSLSHWINDGLLSIFFLVVGLEIKREFTVGRLATRRTAALPIAAAIGGMAVPALLYALVIPAGPWAQGWGVPMATDTAFAVALIVMLGTRVPVELRIFLTAAAIVDDIGAILVVALFYSSDLHLGWLGSAAVVMGALWLLNSGGVYRALPYALLGLVLWVCVLAGGLHATLAGVLLALVMPTRPPPNLEALMAQAQAVISGETQRGDAALRHGPSLPALQLLDAIHDRLESPADRLLRVVEPWSSYLVLPLFALANAGVVFAGIDPFGAQQPLVFAIALGLVVGKPLGLWLGCWIAVRANLAVKPDAYSWPQVLGVGALAGIGFTMSLFIAGEAFTNPADFAAAKVSIFAASVLSAIVGVAILSRSERTVSDSEPREPAGDRA